MIYEKNRKDSKLDIGLFENPTSEFRATPFWAWNCVLDKNELLRQIDIFKEMGYGGYHIHARRGLSTPYMKKDFMELVKACVKYGKEKEMLTWLYDEDRWPSGYAGGEVTKSHEFRQCRLEVMSDKKHMLGNEYKFLTCFDIVLDENKRLQNYRVIGENDDATGTKWFAYITQSKPTPGFNNQTYVDTLNKKAIEKFIQVTHEVYAREVGDEFGKSIPSIFTDEPQFVLKSTLGFPDSKGVIRIPWTYDLVESYQKKYGESLIESLPELFWELKEGVSLTRYRYHDHVAERFAESFVDTCGKWCDEHGLALTGHMLDEHSLMSQTCSVGDVMRHYRSFGIPGIDILRDNYEFATAKQCQSTVHQYGRPGMLSELDGVTGWDFDFRNHKLHGDWQAALGVTIRVPHLAWVSMKGQAKRDYPASISYQSSWYKEYGYIEDHFARVSTAMTRGKPMVRVAVIHPVESYWLHWGPSSQTAMERDKLEQSFENVTNWLLKGSIDFDYICESLFPSLTEKGGAPLKVGEMEYDAVVIPECETLRSTTLERLEAFEAAGGKLIFMGDAPKYEDAKVSNRGLKLYEKSTCIGFNRASLLESLNDFRYIEIRKKNSELTDNLVHQLRRDNDGMWLFIAHCVKPCDKDLSLVETVNVTVKGEVVPQVWDTQTGNVKPIAFTQKNGNTVITADLYEYDSLLLFLADENTTESFSAQPESTCIALNNTPSRVEFELSEPNVLMLDTARFSLDGGKLWDKEEVLRINQKLRDMLGYPKSNNAQPYVIEKSPSDHSVLLEFSFFSDIDFDGAALALEDADKAQISFNGEIVRYEDIGYYTDRSIRKTRLPKIKVGENILRVILPYGERDNIERVYILGDFGVEIAGRDATVTTLPRELAFDDITRQKLPFYGGSVKYKFRLNCPKDGEYSVNVPHYRAAVIAVFADGERTGTIAYAPYSASLGHLSAGTHEIIIEAFISRQNCFGPIHCADTMLNRVGSAGSWSPTDSAWTYEYRLTQEGIISSPVFYKKG